MALNPVDGVISMPLAVGFSVSTYCKPLPAASSQLLRRVELVPPPVQDMKNRPYQSRMSEAPHAEYPPCNCPNTRWFWSKSGEPDEPGSVAPRLVATGNQFTRRCVPSPGDESLRYVLVKVALVEKLMLFSSQFGW